MFWHQATFRRSGCSWWHSSGGGASCELILNIWVFRIVFLALDQKCYCGWVFARESFKGNTTNGF